MKYIYLFLLAFLFIIPIYSQTKPNPIKFTNTATTISFEWGLNDNNYYTKWIIKRLDDKEINLNFTCIKDSISLKCIYTNTDSTLNQLYGKSIRACINSSSGIENCDSQLGPIHYPTPIFSTPILPLVDGGNLILTGSFLKFISTPNYYEIDSTTKVTFISNTSSLDFNPTNVTLGFPKGCGSKSIILPNGNKIQFNYQNAMISTANLIGECTIELNGSNFCDDQNSTINIKFDGKSIEKNFYSISSSSKLIFNCTQDYSSTGVPILVGSSNTVSIAFPPIIYSYDPFCDLDGDLIIHGKRLLSKNPNSTRTISVENSKCINPTGNTTYLKCSLGPGYDKLLMVTIDGLSSNSIDFYYELPIIYNVTMQNTMVIINGWCFSKISNVNVDNVATAFKGSASQLSFPLDGKYYQKTDITIYNIKYFVPTTITPTLFANVSTAPLVDETVVKLDIYYVDPENLITCNGKSKLTGNEYTNGSFFAIDPICGSITVEVSDSINKITVPITSGPGKIESCYLLSNFSTLCTGQHLSGESLISPHATVLFSGKQIPTTFLNSTSFMFTTLDDFSAGSLYLNFCTISNEGTYNLLPMILSYDASGFSKTGGIVTFSGRYFTNSTNIVISGCGNGTIQCTTNSYSTITCPITINGPYDKKCNASYDGKPIPIGDNKDGSIIISFSNPLPLSTNSLNLEGGSLLIFGDYFYKTNDPLIVSVGNISCNNPIIFDESFIQCNLASNPTTNYSTIFDELQDVNVTLAGKSGVGKIFTYNRYQSLSTTKEPLYNAMYIITAIVIIIGLCVAYLKFIFYYKKNRKDFVSNYNLIKKQCKQQTNNVSRPQLQIPESRVQSYANY
ncbi:hypothetical protein RB653_003217 [Dictyostelium firmibasis]|uniref:TgrO1-like immunoglobulin-like domain-containing protein n=1 Tax=Dictyostelium firmibasis TaxID=79012 RepID=A0AAN7TXZ5_9MYCE